MSNKSIVLKCKHCDKEFPVQSSLNQCCFEDLGYWCKIHSKKNTSLEWLNHVVCPKCVEDEQLAKLGVSEHDDLQSSNKWQDLERGLDLQKNIDRKKLGWKPKLVIALAILIAGAIVSPVFLSGYHTYARQLNLCYVSFIVGLTIILSVLAYFAKEKDKIILIVVTVLFGIHSYDLLSTKCPECKMYGALNKTKTIRMKNSTHKEKVITTFYRGGKKIGQHDSGWFDVSSNNYVDKYICKYCNTEHDRFRSSDGHIRQKSH